MIHDFKKLKVGDKVIVHSSHGGEKVAEIQKLTPTRIIVNSQAYNEIGFLPSPHYNSYNKWLSIPTQSDLDRCEKKEEKKRLCKLLSNACWGEYPLETLRYACGLLKLC